MTSEVIRIISFNVLAPHYADPNDYPPNCDFELGREYRRERILKFLTEMKYKCDIIALQEVTLDTEFNGFFRKGEYQHFIKLLSKEFYHEFVAHDLEFCDEWKNYPPDSEFGRTINGNALFFRKDLFNKPKWYNLKLSDKGNRAICGKVKHLPTEKTIKFTNIHFSSGRNTEYRLNECSNLLNQLVFDPDHLDIIVGDFNNGICIAPFNKLIEKHNFINSLIDIDNQRTYSMYDRPRKKFPVDHCIYRGKNILVIPTSSEVLTNNAWEEYPFDEQFDKYQSERLKKCLSLYGSDHFPILIKFKLNYPSIKFD